MADSLDDRIIYHLNQRLQIDTILKSNIDQ